MDPHRWRRLKSLLEDVLAQPASDRAARLAQAAAQNGDLAGDLAALVAAHESDPAFIEPAPRRVPPAPPIGGDDPRLGKRVGPYRLVRPIASGGMGSVYLAARDDDAYRQHVAVKLLRADLGTDPDRRGELLRRFRLERQTLAQLEHPHIARLLDGGATDAGEPFLVMEYVEGHPITEFCDRNRLPLRARLTLFQQVCRAVAFAHRNLVVHRDLKPRNILVTAQGEPKLLDFGIAKLLDPSRVEGADLTRTAQAAMTPAYASPEQIAGQPVTIATDVYSLGVVLYELVTGAFPYAVAGRPPHEVARLICEADPPPPSTCAGRTVRRRRGAGERAARPDRSSHLALGGEAPGPGDGGSRPAASWSGGGASDLPRVGRAAAREIDAIVLTALRKEPERRYAGAERLSEDIARFLDGRPVLACAATRRYRAAKFARRHAGVMAAGALLTVAIAIGMIGTLWQAGVARTQRDAARWAERVADQRRGEAEAAARRAQRAEQASRREAQTTRRLVEYLQNVFVQANPSEAPGAVTAQRVAVSRELLEDAAARIEQDLADEPRVRAAALGSLAQVFRTLGNRARAQELAERGAAISAGLGDEPGVELASCLTELGNLRLDAGDGAGAVALHERALAAYRAVLGEDGPEVARSLVNLGAARRRARDLEGAVRDGQAGLEMYRRLMGEEHPYVASAMENLALAHKDRREYETSETLLREALALRRRIHGPGHASIATTLNDLALLLRERGAWEEAEGLVREAIDSTRATLGEGRELATQLNTLGMVLAGAGRRDEARVAFEESLTLRRRWMGEGHTEVAASLNNLATLRSDARDWAGAESLLREALAIRELALGEEDAQTLLTVNNLGVVLFQAGRYAEAERLALDALDKARRRLSGSDPRIGDLARLAGECLAAQGRRGEALPLLREYAEGLRARYGEQDRRTRAAMSRVEAVQRSDAPGQANERAEE